LARKAFYTESMHSNVLSSKFLSGSQEQRINAILEGCPRFSPWGVSEWDSFSGYKWTTVVAGKVPDAVLFRESDHAAVLEVPRYTNLIYVDETSMAFTCTNDGVPTLYIVRRPQMDQFLEPVPLKALEGSTYFPSLDRREIVAALPGLPELIAGHYFLGDHHYIWVLNTRTGEFDHNPVRWFNDSGPELGFESIELVRVDLKTKMLVGGGGHIPNFVMSVDGSTLLTFVRRYNDDELDPVSARLVEKWTERLQRQVPMYLS
jgi:hypothetical protein